jgi:hypothetical protein
MPDPVTAIASSVASSAIGSVVSGKSAKKGAKIQAQAARDGADAARQAESARLEQLLGYAEPFTQAAKGTNDYLRSLFGVPGSDPTNPQFGSYAAPIGMEDPELDPGYGFRFDQGMRALDRSASARGRLTSGNATRDTMELGQGLASQEFGNAFNRALTRRQFEVDRRAFNTDTLLRMLGSNTGVVQGAMNAIGGTGAREAAYAEGGITGAGNANAAGVIGQGNAFADFFGNAGNAILNFPAYSASFGGGAGSPGPDGATSYGRGRATPTNFAVNRVGGLSGVSSPSFNPYARR